MAILLEATGQAVDEPYVGELRVSNPLDPRAWYYGRQSPKLNQSVAALGSYSLAFLIMFLIFTQISSFNIGVVMTNSSHGAMLINTFVFWVAAIEHFVTRNVRLDLGITERADVDQQRLVTALPNFVRDESVLVPL